MDPAPGRSNRRAAECPARMAVLSQCHGKVRRTPFLPQEARAGAEGVLDRHTELVERRADRLGGLGDGHPGAPVLQRCGARRWRSRRLHAESLGSESLSGSESLAIDCEACSIRSTFSCTCASRAVSGAHDSDLLDLLILHGVSDLLTSPTEIRRERESVPCCVLR